MSRITTTSSKSSDILLLGATGFTGRLVTKYLLTHPQRHLFSVSLGARSLSKLDGLLKQWDLDLESISKDGVSVKTVQVDVTNERDLDKVVKGVRVVVNTVGPFAQWGTPVIRACAKHGIHYVDLTGETFWIKEVISEFDYLASKTGSVIVPSCGMDSIPSDLSVFLSNETLRALPNGTKYEIKSSVTGHKVKGGLSGGTLASVLYALEQVDRRRLSEGGKPHALSPVMGAKRFKFRLLYDLTFPGLKPLVGAWFFMSAPNTAIVERSRGLLEYHAAYPNGRYNSDDRIAELRKAKYGKEFKYDEFMVFPNKVSAFVVISTVLLGFGLFIFSPPFRWLAKKLLPKPGEGPSESTMKNGYLVSTNRTEAHETLNKPPVIVKSVLRGKGDPGYALTAVMLAESALCLILPSTSSSGSTLSSWPLYAQARRKLPVLSREGGGVFTPATAFGNVLVERLRASGKFEFESQVVSMGGGPEGKKVA